jgi:hypothetical protein
MGIKLLAVKRGNCLKKLIPVETSLTFGLKLA